MRIKDIADAAQSPSVDDFTVIDGNTHGPRKIHLGTSVGYDVPASGNAASSQVVLGNDTRLVPPADKPLDSLSDVHVPTPGNFDSLVYSSAVGMWVSSTVTDGGNF